MQKMNFVQEIETAGEVYSSYEYMRFIVRSYSITPDVKRFVKHAIPFTVPQCNSGTANQPLK